MCVSLKSIRRRRIAWSSDWNHTSGCPILRKSDNRPSPIPGALGGEDPTPGISAALGNPAVVNPSTLFLFKAPDAPLPLSRRVIRGRHLDIRTRKGRLQSAALGSHYRGRHCLPSIGFSGLFMSFVGSTDDRRSTGSP